MKIHLPLLVVATLWCGSAVAGPSPVRATTAPAAPAAGLAVPFVANDYATVLADAQKRHVPVFVDNWAMW